MLEINTLPRQAKEKTNVGFIPAVYYGAHTPATSIFINAIEFTKVFASAGESSTVTLKTEKGNETVLIQAVQKHPVKSHVIHVDFYVLEKGQKVHVKVPVSFTGESAAVKAGGVLVKVLHEISIEAEQNAIPHDFVIDISALVDAQSTITARDIVLPKGASLYHMDENEIIASIAQAKEESADAPTAIDLSTIEVVEKGKKEEEPVV